MERCDHEKLRPHPENLQSIPVDRHEMGPTHCHATSALISQPTRSAPQEEEESVQKEGGGGREDGGTPTM